MPAGQLRYACVAGTCAALGSLFGKLTAPDARRALLQDIVEDSSAIAAIVDGWPVTVAFVGLMLLSNAMVWTFFVRALHGNGGGSLAATVTSAAVNYCLSALGGCLLFGERTSLVWWSGTALVLCGLVLIGTDQSNAEEAEPGRVVAESKHKCE